VETFVVRVWAPHRQGRAEEATAALHGVVEHVRSGSSRNFDGGDELMEFLRSTAAVGPPRPEGVVRDAE
jgi:hypothetical protein